MGKPTHVFDYDQEPADERPSQFDDSRMNSLMSGYHQLPDRSVRRAPRRPHQSNALRAIMLSIAAGVAVIIWFANYLRG